MGKSNCAGTIQVLIAGYLGTKRIKGKIRMEDVMKCYFEGGKFRRISIV